MSERFDAYYKWLGIPPSQQPPHHYRLLGLELFETDREVIEAAANQRMAYLQDVATGEYLKESQRLLNEMAAARRCLLQTDQKADYDQRLRATIADSGSSSSGTAGSHSGEVANVLPDLVGLDDKGSAERRGNGPAAARTRGLAGREPRSAKPWWQGPVGWCLLGALPIAGALIVFTMISSQPPPPPPAATVTVFWRLSERTRAVLLVDGRARSLPADTDDIKLRMGPGKHVLEFRREGFNHVPPKLELTLEAGEQRRIVTNWTIDLSRAIKSPVMDSTGGAGAKPPSATKSSGRRAASGAK